MNKSSLLCLLLPVVLSTACRKKTEEPVKDTTGSISINLEHMAGNEALVLDIKWYKNENGDSIKFGRFDYFISNIKFIRPDGTSFAEPESYHLVLTSSASSKTFVVKNVPPGAYKSVSFLIGVDSARNVSGAQTGALDPATGMFWDWNTGYIMAKLEAISPQSPNDGNVQYHTGGFSGTVNVLRTVTLPVSITAQVGVVSAINMKADVLEWFKTPNLIKIKDMPTFGNAQNIVKIADNYADMFTIIP